MQLEDLQARLKNRLEALTREAQLSPLPPVVQGGALVVPRGLLQQCQGAAPAPAVSTADTQAGATTPHCASAHPQHGFPV